MGDVNHQHINGNVSELNGIKIEKLVITQDIKPFPRKQYVREILQLRSSCPHLEFLINTHAEKAYGSRFFKEMPEEHLLEMYQFVVELELAVKGKKVSWIEKIANWLKIK